MDLKTIQEILKFVSRTDLAEVEIEEEGFKLRIKRTVPVPEVVYAPAPQMMYAPPAMPLQQPAHQQQVASPAIHLQAAPAQQAAPSQEVAPTSNAIEQKSPMIGTFYRKPSPEAAPFVKEGDFVQKGQVLCIIEAMKLFNEIEAEVTGKVLKVLAEDQTPVEYDQPLFLIEAA